MSLATRGEPMPKRSKAERPQISASASEETRRNLEKLCKAYAARVGLAEPLSQAQALEIALREAVERLEKR